MADPKQVTDRGLEAWRARDADAFAGCYAENATIVGPGGMELHGREGARQFIGMWIEGVPDNELTIAHEHVCGSVVVQEGIFSGTHTGNLVTPDGQVIPATGRSLRAPFADVFEIGGDRIKSERLYYDQVELLTQLGLLPAAAAATS
jgi:ketosteroid isomerase-like protein